MGQPALGEAALLPHGLQSDRADLNLDSRRPLSPDVDVPDQRVANPGVGLKSPPVRKRPKTPPRKALESPAPADDGHLSTCMVCRDKRPFALPEPLVAAAKSRDLVLFAGAGISTEGRRVFPISLRDQLAGELAAEHHEVPSEESFPGVASA